MPSKLFPSRCPNALKLSSFAKRLGAALFVTLLTPIASQAVDVCPTCTYKSINYAINAQSNPAGITINVSGGPYRERVLVNNKDGAPGVPFVIRAQGPVTIDGRDPYNNPALWQEVIPGDSTYVANDTSDVAGTLDWFVLVDDTLYQYVNVGTSWGNIHKGQWSIDATPSPHELYINVGGGNPGDREVYFAHLNGTMDITFSNHVIIDGFTIVRSNDKGIDVHGNAMDRATGVVIRNCNISKSRQEGILFDEAVRCSVQKDTSSYNHRHGIYITDSDSIHITRNVCYRNDDPFGPRNYAGIKLGGDTVFTHVRDVNIDYNVVYENDDTGIDLRGSRRVVVRRNVSFRNGDHGYDNNHVDSTAFLNNVAFRNDHDGLSVESSANNVRVYNCILAHNGLNAETLVGGDRNVRELFVDNASGFQSDHNLIKGLSPGAIAGGERHLVEFRQPGGSRVAYDDLGTYVGATDNLDENSVSSNPIFTDTTAVFTIASASSDAVDEGKSDLTGWVSPWLLSADANGVALHDEACKEPNGGAGSPAYADIGAFERNVPPAGSALQIAAASGDALNVAWTAPGEDTDCGTASAYDLRYQLSGPVDASNFGSCTQVSTDPPHAAGYAEHVTVTGFPDTTTVYFGLKTRDGEMNWSVLTTGSGRTAGGPPGGGGGCNDDPNCMDVSARPAEGYVAKHIETTRIMDLRGSINLGYIGTAYFRIDSLRLMEVAHGADSLVVMRDGELLVGELEEPAAVFANGQEAAGQMASTGLAATPNDTLEVRFAVTDRVKAGAALVMDLEVMDSAGGYVQMRIPVGGKWRRIARVTPGPGRNTLVVDEIEADTLQLVFSGTSRVRSVKRVVPDTSPSGVTSVAIESGHLSTIGDVPVPAGDASVTMAPGEMLRLTPVAGGTTGGGIRERFLRYRVSQSSTAPTRQKAGDATVPAAFALSQNRPNPFSAATLIRFSLPVRSTSSSTCSMCMGGGYAVWRRVSGRPVITYCCGTAVTEPGDAWGRTYTSTAWRPVPSRLRVSSSFCRE